MYQYVGSQCRGHRASGDQHVAPDSDLPIAPALTAAPPQPVNVRRRAFSCFSMSFFPVDVRPHQHLQHLLFHSLTQVVICTTIDAKQTLGRGRCIVETPKYFLCTCLECAQSGHRRRRRPLRPRCAPGAAMAHKPEQMFYDTRKSRKKLDLASPNSTET
jgi:hypothetical protein